MATNERRDGLHDGYRSVASSERCLPYLKPGTRVILTGVVVQDNEGNHGWAEIHSPEHIYIVPQPHLVMRAVHAVKHIATRVLRRAS